MEELSELLRWRSGQQERVSDPVRRWLVMDDFQVKVGKVEQSLGLVAIEVLGLTEVCQVLVVSESLDREEGAMGVVSPGL